MIAAVARLLCPELTLQNECLRPENRILKEKASGRIWFTEEERRSLMRVSSAASSPRLVSQASVSRPETLTDQH